jgi:hypothetical protein
MKSSKAKEPRKDKSKDSIKKMYHFASPELRERFIEYSHYVLRSCILFLSFKYLVLLIFFDFLAWNRKRNNLRFLLGKKKIIFKIFPKIYFNFLNL